MEYVINTYAAYYKEHTVRMDSSSGGMFTLIACDVLSEGGVVYGVAMTEDCYGAEFIRTTDDNGLKRIRGSKYVQAKVGNTFKSVKNDLDSGLMVLFTGTGCQVNGLRKFLNKDYLNLFCVDVVCHGTPSPKLWKEYVEFQEAKYDGKMIYASFRNKERNKWDGFEMKEKIENQTDVYLSRHTDPYFSLFVENLSLRPSCFNCAAKKEKLSDITIADFWGINDVAPDLNDEDGISLVITRTKKGQSLFEKICNSLTFRKVTYEQGVSQNKSEYKSYECPQRREEFFFDFRHMSFENLEKKYLHVPLWKKSGRAIKCCINKILSGGVNSDKRYTYEDYHLKCSFKNNCAE